MTGHEEILDRWEKGGMFFPRAMEVALCYLPFQIGSVDQFDDRVTLPSKSTPLERTLRHHLSRNLLRCPVPYIANTSTWCRVGTHFQ